ENGGAGGSRRPWRPMKSGSRAKRSTSDGRRGSKARRSPCGLRTVAPDRLGIGRVSAHVYPALPSSPQGVDDFQRHPADALDVYFDGLAVLQCTEPFVVGAAGDQIASV